MHHEDALFPPDYWTEAEGWPALRIVPLHGGREFRIVRYYRSQEDGVVARSIELANDHAAAHRIVERLAAIVEIARPKRAT